MYWRAERDGSQYYNGVTELLSFCREDEQTTFGDTKNREWKSERRVIAKSSISYRGIGDWWRQFLIE